MTADILTRLSQATSAEEREWLLLEMSMEQLDDEVETAVWAAAIPHWFDIPFLANILDRPQLESLDQISSLSFIEQYPGRGFNMHERSRRYFLKNLWQNNPDQFRLYSARAAAYCGQQDLDKPEWRVEQIYHLLISDPDKGSNLLRQSGMAWQNFPYNDYEQVEALTRVALEHREAGRLTAGDENWALYWQAHLDMLFERDTAALDNLAHMQVDPSQDRDLAALRFHAQGDLYRRTGDDVAALATYESALAAYAALGQTFNATVIQTAVNELTPTDTNETAVISKGISEPKPEEKSPPPQEKHSKKLTKAQKIRLALLDKVKTAWLDGVLKQAVPYEITVDMQSETEMVAPAIAMTLHAPGQMDQAVPQNVPLLDLFRQSGRSLLILGAPGSGKTIALLQLTRQLHQQALADDQAPLPLVFNLSSWGQKRGPLAEWLANEAHLQYQVGRKFTRETLLSTGNLTLLLDGLDEVPLAARDACVDAINEFLAQYDHDVVVCSRIGDYEALQSRLTLAHAIVLQPLTNQQITAFIDQVAAEDQREAMQRQIAEQRPLREALRSPLLLNLYPHAFPAMTTAAEGTVAAFHQAIFEAYVDTAVVQKITSAKYATNYIGKSKEWLAFLANGMQQAGKTLFFVEELQPTWLPQHQIRRYRGLYGLALGLIVGLIFGLIFGLSEGVTTYVAEYDELGSWLANEFGLWSTGRKTFGLLVGLSGGLIIGGGCGAIATTLTTGIRQSWLRVGSAAMITGLVSGLFFGQIGSLNTDLIVGLIDDLIDALIFGPNEGVIGSLIFGVSTGLLVGLGLIVSVALASLARDIQLREAVKILWPSRQHLLKYMLSGILYAIVVSLIVWLLNVLVFKLIAGQVFGLSVGIILGLGVVFGVIFSLLDTPHVDIRPYPGKGVGASLRNALLITLLVFILLGASVWFIDGRFKADGFFLIIVLTNILPIVFTWFGGLAWCQHKALRFTLSRQGLLPRQLVPWLDAMVALGLLRRVGGGYIFIHRGLLEYFAETATAN